MGIIYILSIVILIGSFVLIKKTEKEINIVSFIGISIVALFCYNAFLCYILTFFLIPITLGLLVFINLAISTILILLMLKNKEIQKYIFNRLDTIYVLIISLITLIVSYINFGIPLNIKYETSDPSVHYLTSVKFAESEALLPNAEPDEVYGSLNVRKTVSYVNSGLLMKCLCQDLKPMECYNVFVAFGIFTLFLTGLTMYSAMANLVKKKEYRFWAFALALICMLGYPLNSFLFGFEYLSMGLLVICAILDLVYYYEKEILDIKLFMLLMALLNFGLFCSYYMFVPFMYPALWIYFYIKNYQNTHKIITKNIIILWLVTLLIPFILGYIYHLEPNIYAILINKSIDLSKLDYSTGLMTSGFAMNGYIYINLYSNMFLLLPLPIYLLFEDANKNKLKNNMFIAILLWFILLFIEILFIGMILGKVSIYYLSKNYFALWIILIYSNFKALIFIAEKNKKFPRLCIGLYVFFMIICTIFSDVKLIDDALTNPDETIFSTMEIFGANKTMLFKEPEKLNQEEIEILMYARDNLDYNSKIEVVSEGIQYYWSYVLTRYINYEEAMDKIGWGQFKLNIKVLGLENKINNVDYMIYFNRSKMYNILQNEMFKNAKIIYENSSGGILKYNR